MSGEKGLGCHLRPGIEKQGRVGVLVSELEKRRSGMLAHCYSKHLPATQQQQQQQEQYSHPSGDQDSRQGSRQGQRQPNLVPRKPSNAGCTSEKSSMGTELDNADSELKQFTEQGFRSLSTPPPLDYLDVRDSSSRTSADGSQISADGDSAASTWYAELNVSAQSDSDDDSLSHLQLEGVHDNDGECLGVSGFECVDVALENREEEGKGVGPKTVPKRQILLRRCSTEETLAAASGGLRAGTLPQCHEHPKATFCRQYSTPATIQGTSYEASAKSPPSNQKQRLQKSFSLDETSSRTKMASSLIKNVLSKKMQFEQKIQQQTPEEVGFSQSCPDKGTPKTRVGNLLRSWSQEVTPAQAELDPEGGWVHQHGNVSTKTHQKLPDDHSLHALPSGRGSPGESQSRDAGRSKPHLSWRQTQLAGGKAGEREHCSDDSAKTGTGNGAGTWFGATGRVEGECQTSPRDGKQLSTESCFQRNLPEIARAPCTREEKRESECFPKYVEIGVASEAVRPLCDMVLEARETAKGGGETGNREDSQKAQKVAPLHRVRDVRKLVKSTYGSPFNFSDTSGERHPEKKIPVPPHVSAQTPSDETRETGSLCLTLNYHAFKGGAPVLPHNEMIAMPKVSELGTREARVPPSMQKPLAKVTSATKPTVTTGYSQQLPEIRTTPGYLPRPRVPPTSSYSEQPQQVKGVTRVSAYKQQPTPAATAPICSRLPTATTTPSYKMPRRDLTSCPFGSALIGGLQENFGLPPTRSQDHNPLSSMGSVQSCAKDSQHLQIPSSLHHPGPMSYQAASSNMPPKDTVHPLVDQASNGHGTLLNYHPDPSKLTWAKPDRGRSRSPHRPPIETQLEYASEPGGLPTAFAPEPEDQAVAAGSKVSYLPGGGGLVFGQNPHRLLLDPETGTCFYVEMPAQPRRKVLFDPESGQYMEVLLPSQGLYPASINPCAYPYLAGPGLYPHQYLPYSVVSLPQGT